MRAGSKIKVDRLLLIDRLEEAHASNYAEYEKKLKKHEESIEKGRVKAIENLKKLLAKYEADPSTMDLSNTYSGEAYITIGKINYQAHPDQERGYRYNPDTLAKMISILKLSNETTVLVAVGDDYYYYL